jgi:acyl carrier protein
MSQPTIEEQVKIIFLETFGVGPEELTPSSHLCDDLSLDSLDIVELAMAIEEEMLDGEEMDDETVDNWRTFEDVVRSVEALVEKKAV